MRVRSNVVGKWSEQCWRQHPDIDGGGTSLSQPVDGQNGKKHIYCGHSPTLEVLLAFS